MTTECVKMHATNGKDEMNLFDLEIEKIDVKIANLSKALIGGGKRNYIIATCVGRHLLLLLI